MKKIDSTLRVSQKPTSYLEAVFWTTTICFLISRLNGFPFVFFDSAGYIEQAFDLGTWGMRPVIYSLFLRAALISVSVWIPVFVQCALFAVMLWLWARTTLDFPLSRLSFLVVNGAVLAAGGAFVIPSLMPDCFSAGLILALDILLTKKRERLSRSSFFFCAAYVVFTATSHLSHLLLFTVLFILVSPSHVWHKRWTEFFVGITLVALTWLVLPVTNFGLFNQFKITQMGSLHQLGAFWEEGIIEKVCRENPSYQSFALCTEAIKKNSRSDAGNFLWNPNGVLNRIGGYAKVKQEADQLVRTAILQQPMLIFYRSLSRWYQQMSCYSLYDYTAKSEENLVQRTVDKRLPDQAEALASSRQQNRKISVGLFARMQNYILFLSVVLFLAIFFLLSFSGESVRRITPQDFLFLPLAMGINAYITSNLSMVSARYQCRVVFLVPLVALVMKSRLSARSPSPSLAVKAPLPLSNGCGLRPGASEEVRS